MRTSLCDGWEFTPEWTDGFAVGEGQGEAVRLPHNPREIPLHGGSPADYEGVWGYRRRVQIGGFGRVFLQLDGAAHQATVFVNGTEVGAHACGYTAFRLELTDYLRPGEKAWVAVRLDSTEDGRVPPFGYVIDYLTYAGLYREAWLDVYPTQTVLADVFVKTPDLHTAVIQVEVDKPQEGQRLQVKIADESGNTVWEAAADGDAVWQAVDADGDAVRKTAGVDGNAVWAADADGDAVREAVEADGDAVWEKAAGGGVLVTARVPCALPWSMDAPHLYRCQVTLTQGAEVVDVREVCFGFRTAVFRGDGFYLNGERVFLRGLDRHQCWPYIGYAAPRRLQVEDARILKEELGCNVVRTSHYPQSQGFLDACDALGLAVITELPGWQHIGGEDWKAQCMTNIEEMILQNRNHPSVLLWGVRINESVDDDPFYTRTNALAHALDPTRGTTGIRNFEKSHLLEDVYAFNDFSHTGDNPGVLPKAQVTPDMSKALIISECNGHMFPTKPWDNWERRQEHALRHAKVQGDAFYSHCHAQESCDTQELPDGVKSSAHAGCIAWCMFDYGTHGDFGSGDRVCYHGVLDTFRNPKLAAAVYASQRTDAPVLTVCSSMDIGDYPAGEIGRVYVFSNAERVLLYRNETFVTELRRDETYPLPHPPFVLEGQDLGAWGQKAGVWRFDGLVGGRVAVSVQKGPSARYHLLAQASHTSLEEGDSYDMALVRVRVVDEFGGECPYVQLPVTFAVSGDVALEGPALAVAEGGMTGTFVRSIGKQGKGTLKISAPQAGEVELHFTVTA